MTSFPSPVSSTAASRSLAQGDPRPAAAVDAVRITYYTDPLCAWSWALEPACRRLRYEFGDHLRWRTVLAGMIADWTSFADPWNAVQRPAQMGPLWFQVQQVSGVPIDERIWQDDPPASSYPACLAVKSALRQGEAAGELYLRRLRESLMMGRRNIARPEALLEIAEQMAGGGALDLDRFRSDLMSADVSAAFRGDLTEIRDRDIGRFPTLTLNAGPNRRGLLIVGYRPYEALRAALARIAPGLAPVRRVDDPVEYAEFWGGVLDVEAAEALEIPLEEANRRLDDALADGRLVRDPTLPRMYRPRSASPGRGTDAPTDDVTIASPDPARFRTSPNGG